MTTLPTTFACSTSPASAVTFAGKKATQKPVLFSGKDTVSFTNPVRFGQKSVLEIEPVQAEFVARMQKAGDAALPPGMTAEEFVRQLERQKHIPADVYKKVVEHGLTVVGVPIPSKAQFALALKTNPELMKAIARFKDPKKQRALAQLANTIPNKRFIEELGKAGHAMPQTLGAIALAKKFSVGVATALGVNSGLAAEAISKIGTPEQQAIWLNMMQEGQGVFAYGLTEEKIGSDPRSLQTTWKQDVEGNYVISGNKKFIGGMANVTDDKGKVVQKGSDYLVVFAVDDPNKAPEERDFRAFVVPREAIGEENIERTGGKSGKLGLNEVNNATIQLKDVKVPKEFMLGTGENIYPFLLKSLDETRLFVGAMSLGTTQATLETIQKYVEERVQNGRPIGEFQAVKLPLEQNAADAAAAELLVMSTAKRVDSILKSGEKSEKFRTDTAMSKLFCSELALRSTRNAVQMMGGNGYIEDENGRGIPKRFRDAEVTTIYEGTTNIQRNLIAGGVMIMERNRMMDQAALQATLKSDSKAVQTLKNSESANGEDVVDAAYEYALADVGTRYAPEFMKLLEKWNVNAADAKDMTPPPAYKGWDQKSLIRQAQQDALLPIQMRSHILADIATDRHVLQLANQQLKTLAQKKTLNAAEAKQKAMLLLFKDNAEARALDAYHLLTSKQLARQEQLHQEMLDAKA